MRNILMASTDAQGHEIFDKTKTGCSMTPTKKNTSCGCGCSSIKPLTEMNPEKMIITGTITDKLTNEVLVAANIVNLVTKQGTVSDDNGNFELQASPDDVIQISFVGFKNTNLPASQLPDTVEMEADDMLDEVVLSSAKNRKRIGLLVVAGLGVMYAFSKSSSTTKPKTSPKKSSS